MPHIISGLTLNINRPGVQKILVSATVKHTFFIFALHWTLYALTSVLMVTQVCAILGWWNWWCISAQVDDDVC